MVQPEVRDSLFIPSDSRSNFKNIVAKRPDLLKINGGRLAPSLNGSYQNAGLVLGLASSGPDNGYYKAYNSSNTDGSQPAIGVLLYDANVDASGNGSEIAWVISGELIYSLLIGLDSTAISNLSAKVFTEQGMQILSF